MIHVLPRVVFILFSDPYRKKEVIVENFDPKYIRDSISQVRKEYEYENYYFDDE